MGKIVLTLFLIFTFHYISNGVPQYTRFYDSKPFLRRGSSAEDYCSGYPDALWRISQDALQDAFHGNVEEFSRVTQMSIGTDLSDRESVTEYACRLQDIQTLDDFFVFVGRDLQYITEQDREIMRQFGAWLKAHGGMVNVKQSIFGISEYIHDLLNGSADGIAGGWEIDWDLGVLFEDIDKDTLRAGVQHLVDTYGADFITYFSAFFGYQDVTITDVDAFASSLLKLNGTTVGAEGVSGNPRVVMFIEPAIFDIIFKFDEWKKDMTTTFITYEIFDYAGIFGLK